MLDLRIVHFGKTKASRFVREPIPHHIYITCVNALLLKPGCQISLGGPVRKIPDV